MDIAYGICQACGKYTLIQENLCEPCWKGVLQSIYQMHTYAKCEECGAPMLHEHAVCLHAAKNRMVIRVGPYTGDLRQLVIRYKKTGICGLAKPIAALMSCEIERMAEDTTPVAIIPVPCSERSRRTRGWDHMVLVGRALSANPKHLLIQVLERQGKGELKMLGKQQREIESSRSYRLNARFGRKELALLNSCKIAFVIDDVMTTGSTLDTCISLVAGIVDIRILGLCLAMD